MSETGGILSKPFVKGEGKTIINLVPERRILLYVIAMAGGVILAAAWPDAGVVTMLAAASADMLSGVIAFRCQCGLYVPLFSLTGLQRDNYLLRVDGGELVARATSGQYFRISPVSRP